MNYFGWLINQVIQIITCATNQKIQPVYNTNLVKNFNKSITDDTSYEYILNKAKTVLPDLLTTLEQ